MVATLARNYHGIFPKSLIWESPLISPTLLTNAVDVQYLTSGQMRGIPIRRRGFSFETKAASYADEAGRGNEQSGYPEGVQRMRQNCGGWIKTNRSRDSRPNRELTSSNGFEERATPTSSVRVTRHLRNACTPISRSPRRMGPLSRQIRVPGNTERFLKRPSSLPLHKRRHRKQQRQRGAVHRTDEVPPTKRNPSSPTSDGDAGSNGAKLDLLTDLPTNLSDGELPINIDTHKTSRDVEEREEEVEIKDETAKAGVEATHGIHDTVKSTDTNDFLRGGHTRDSENFDDSNDQRNASSSSHGIDLTDFVDGSTAPILELGVVRKSSESSIRRDDPSTSLKEVRRANRHVIDCTRKEVFHDDNEHHRNRDDNKASVSRRHSKAKSVARRNNALRKRPAVRASTAAGAAPAAKRIRVNSRRSIPIADRATRLQCQTYHVRLVDGMTVREYEGIARNPPRVQQAPRPAHARAVGETASQAGSVTIQRAVSAESVDALGERDREPRSRVLRLLQPEGAASERERADPGAGRAAQPRSAQDFRRRESEQPLQQLVPQPRPTDRDLIQDNVPENVHVNDDETEACNEEDQQLDKVSNVLDHRHIRESTDSNLSATDATSQPIAGKYILYGM
ncbi:hypothetical protein WN51_08684 [Melipona quadrifasciata]|uniref:Uncharacterized protein n=1 Tax=Melipona quadrifasciata TaxID=166423 RepID=A0A0M9A7P0_9HYME|nr:hypothetical protein WN51_08684 [Melipona quadrifasciata]